MKTEVSMTDLMCFNQLLASRPLKNALIHIFGLSLTTIRNNKIRNGVLKHGWENGRNNGMKFQK